MQEISLKKLVTKPSGPLPCHEGQGGECSLPYLTLSERPSQNLAPGQAWERSSLWSVGYPGCTASATGQRTGCLNISHGPVVATWGKQPRPRDILVLFRRATWEGKDSNRECLGELDGQKTSDFFLQRAR